MTDRQIQKRKKAVEKYIEKSLKNANGGTLNYGATIQGDYQYVHNKYTALKLKNHIGGLLQAENPLTFNKIFPSYDFYKPTGYVVDYKIDEFITPPENEYNVNVLKEQLKQAKEEERQFKKEKKQMQSHLRLVKIGHQYFSIELLLELYSILGTMEIYQEKSPTFPAILKSGEDEAMILPVYRPERIG